MEQTRGEAQQQEPPPNPFECPRCNSPDTKFRYLNNNKPTQPRYYCRTCKRQWTVGGNLRNIPIRGNSKSGKQTTASSSRYGNPIYQPAFPFGEQHLQVSQSLTPMMVMAPQNFNTAMIQTSSNQPEAVFPQGSNYYSNEISCLDAIQSLIHPGLINQHLNDGNQIGSAGTNMTIPQEQNSQPMASQQAFHQQVTGYMESVQTYNQANSRPPYLHNNSLVQDIPTNFGAPTSNVFSWNNNSWGDTTNTEMDTTSVNVDEWLNFPDNDSL